jgi:flagellar biosynthesis/type III secretory pathway protein FliH
MGSTNSVPLTQPLVGLRLHARRAGGGEPLPSHVASLLDLKQREQQRQASVQAAIDLAKAAQRTIANVPAEVQQRLEQVAGLAVELGLALARELVGAALDQGKVDPTETVVRCLRDCVHGSDRSDLVVKLHPQDLGPVQQALQSRPEVQEETALARFVADPTVPRGGVRAETGAGRLRYDPREVLERISAEVRREASS